MAGRKDVERTLESLTSKMSGGGTGSAERGVAAGASTHELSLESFIETASASVMRAIDARNRRASDERFPEFLKIPPITVGIVFNPEGGVERTLSPESDREERMIPPQCSVFMRWLATDEGQAWLAEEQAKQQNRK